VQNYSKVLFTGKSGCLGEEVATKKNKLDIMSWSIQKRRLLFLSSAVVSVGILIFILTQGNNWMQLHRGITFALLGIGSIAVLFVVWMGLVGAGESNGVALLKAIVFGVLIYGAIGLLNIFSNIKK